MTKIIQKKNKIIQKLISPIIKELISLKDNNLITITSVETALNGLYAKIYISSLKNEKDIINILNANKKKIKHMLTTKIKNYKIPEIDFYLDKSLEYDLIIKKINEKNNEQ
ncbi:MAG TPA: ribosome-binding factor A [Candidatus Azoamicus sp.]